MLQNRNVCILTSFHLLSEKNLIHKWVVRHSVLSAAHPHGKIGLVCIFIERMFVVRDPLFESMNQLMFDVAMVTDMVVLFESIHPHMQTPLPHQALMMFSVYICFFLLLVSSLLFYSQQQMDNGERQKIKSDSLLCITTTDSHEQHMAEQHGALVWQWAPELKEQVAAVLTTTLMPGRLRYRGGTQVSGKTSKKRCQRQKRDHMLPILVSHESGRATKLQMKRQPNILPPFSLLLCEELSAPWEEVRRWRNRYI